MTEASLIISTLSLIISVVCISIMLAKNFFSTHQIQMVPVDPMKNFTDAISSEIGRPALDPFRDLGSPLEDDEIERLNELKEQRKKKFEHKNIT